MIALTADYGDEILVDNEDEDFVRQVGKCPGIDIDYGEDGCLYAYIARGVMDAREGQPLHKLIMGVSMDTEVIHQNGDTLDNRRTNLLIARPGITAKRVREARLGFKSGLKYDAEKKEWYGWYEPKGVRRYLREDAHPTRRNAAIALMRKLLAYEPVRRPYDGRGYVEQLVKPRRNWYFSPSMLAKTSPDTEE